MGRAAHWSLNLPVSVKVDVQVLLETLDDGSKQLGQPSDLGLEERDSALKSLGALRVLVDLALLQEIPEQTHCDLLG
jgi:hypothetical protein